MSETATDPLIAIADYGMGNLHSVRKALEHVGAKVTVTSDAGTLDGAPAVILPGVGAFGDAMTEMRRLGILEVMRTRANEAATGGRPFLGICLGMQVLAREGEEDAGVPGLDVMPGTCPRIPPMGLKVPHMGWNSLNVRKTDNPLFRGLPEKSYVYFVHSYHVVPSDSDWIAATTEYGMDLVVSLWKGNLFATQFHPEKSQRVGIRMLENFLELARGAAA